MKPGSQTFYAMLKEMEEIHEKKSHDYASNDNPFGNYEFAGQVSSMFSHNPSDAGFAGRIAEKIFRLANLERDSKTPKNESIEDTERDIATIVVLWMANRRERRQKYTVYHTCATETVKTNPTHEIIINGPGSKDID